MATENKVIWKKEVSAGGVVYKIGEQSASAKASAFVKTTADKSADKAVFILLIEPKSPNYGPPIGYWTFPKGLVDEGEDLKTAAVREVREEGGVNAEVVSELGMIKYFRKSEAYGNAIKFVHFYLMKYIDGDPADHDNEIAESKWIASEEVLPKLKFTHDKDIFNKARKALET